MFCVCCDSSSKRSYVWCCITSGYCESKLVQCLDLSCDKKKVARFASCDVWNGKHAVVSQATAMFLQKAWGIRNSYMHGTTSVARVSESAW
jgi:hypothetical protein